MARFRRVSSAFFIARAALGAVWRCGGARRLCVRCAFTETAGAGISASVGPNERAALQSSRGAGSFLRCMSRRVHGAWKHAEKRASAGGLRMPETALFLPEEWGDVTSESKAKPGSPIWGTGLANLYAHERELLQYCFSAGGNPGESSRNLYAV